MILTLSPLNARKNVATVRDFESEWVPWQIENSLNHQHPTVEFSRHGLRVAREMGADLTEALREAYPERNFVIEYHDEEMSFYQCGENVPETSEPPGSPLPDTARCDVCDRQRDYRLREQTDPEFPQADWGECVECGAEILLRTWKIRTDRLISR